jgi:hypothetical protein
MGCAKRPKKVSGEDDRRFELHRGRAMSMMNSPAGIQEIDQRVCRNAYQMIRSGRARRGTDRIDGVR